MTGLGPFDLPGMPFLALYFVLFVMALAASLIIPRWLRPEGRSAVVSDPDRLAYLAGGAVQYVDALVARLYARGAVSIDRKQGLTMHQPPGESAGAAEIALLGLPSPVKYATIDRQLKGHAEMIRDKLVEGGLLLDSRTALQLRFWQSLPFIALTLFGAVKWEVGTMRERPVEFLIAFLALTVLAAMLRFAKHDRRTRAGQAVLDDARRRQERLRRAAPGDEAGMAVALFGTAALAGSSWSDLHNLRRDNAGGDGGGAGDSSSGDGGCGGGGCGGCGS